MRGLKVCPESESKERYVLTGRSLNGVREGRKVTRGVTRIGMNGEGIVRRLIASGLRED